MATLAQLARAAGLQTVDSTIVIPNFQLPIVGRLVNESTFEERQLFCDKDFGRPADLTILYFTLPECENCRQGALSVERLQSSTEPSSPNRVCARVVVSDWPTSFEVSQEFVASGLQKLDGMIWDAKGVLSERLAVVAQPAVFFLDKGGKLLAYQNGAAEFASPGFAVFWESLKRVMAAPDVRASETALGQVFASERPELSTRPAKFLNQSILSGVWLVVLGLLCYTLVRFFLRRRKNFTGSAN